MSDAPENPDAKGEELLDKPKIYVSWRGERYVKAEDVLRSKNVRKLIEKMAKIPVSRKNF